MGDGSSAPSGATMVDAQLTAVKVLKPFDGFERVYQGQPALTPIAFPGALDPRAKSHQAGFDPDLMAGIPVPEGARVVLWFPVCFSPVPPGNVLAPFQLYSYRLIWRYQNLAGYRNPAARHRRPPWHFPRQSPGASDSSSGTALPRAPLPASWHVIAYEQTEPVTGAGSLVVRVEDITPRMDSIAQFIQPLLPNGRPGVIQQGVMDPASLGADSGAPLMPTFLPFWTDAEGDELIVLATRFGGTTDPADLWDFTDPALDLAFSNIYGDGDGRHARFRDIGIYLQTGTTP